MTERLYILEDLDPEDFYGANKENLMLLRTLFPKLRIVGQGRVIKVQGEIDAIQQWITTADLLVSHIVKYGSIHEDTIRKIASGDRPAQQQPTEHHILYGNRGKSIIARGKHQQEMVRLFETHDMMFATGPAGTGKTFVAISLAVKALKERRVRRIILSRPAVEAGEKLGFLPGEMKDKLDPYLQPLYDALEEMIPAVKLKDYIENGTIQIAPLAYMRGRTLNDAIIILDEAQNTTSLQMKMFLTRLGQNSKMLITGDLTQTDLPRGVKSGLRTAVELLKDIKPIAFISFDKADIVRHPIVQLIVEAYDANERQFKETQE